MHSRQWVCVSCGYNMIGEMADACPFCGADRDKFISWEEAEKVYRVTSNPVNDCVTQLLSVPGLGLEHAAYRVETDKGAVWIDCPSAFNRNLKSVEAIFFTHPHFMGAANLYRKLWQARVFLHTLDAENRLTQQFLVDVRFKSNFNYKEIEAYHVGGHTPGYTVYIYQDVLFICDYAFPPGNKMQLNPHGPNQETRQGALGILKIIKEKQLTTVCGYNYVVDYHDWLLNFESVTVTL